MCSFIVALALCYVIFIVFVGFIVGSVVWDVVKWSVVIYGICWILLKILPSSSLPDMPCRTRRERNP